jgi:hypothetical protein
MKLKIFLLSLSFIFLVSNLFGKSFNFYREDLSFTLTKTHLKVDGLYYFSNDSDEQVSYILFYPYPADSLMGMVDSSFVFDQDGKSCKLSDRMEGMSFGVKIAAHDTTVCRIGYRQELKGRSARYILLTTQEWGEPFKEVNYQLTSSIKNLKFNYKPDSKKKSGKDWIYKWHKTNFMPDRDFIIYF